ncbi:hypothetical protein D2E29_02270 [Mycobacteroides abscessus]|nr:hypothetical protein DDJ61_10410 [Mycobacteroides abscessus]QBE79959.1 hypothetical protein EXM25_22245 [Mycobacteroides abscessus subsp. massiliense]RWU59242.1 hypothetical protein EPJ93_13970 [Mycobacteroides abscessus subsp. abscessus]PVA25745.1 hypothetical protein DDJ46_02280 [Mycobacteroides abscessus]PVA55635.1 hypothetical protein DDJ73_02280 [Mycobacteroides abscessus]
MAPRIPRSVHLIEPHPAQPRAAAPQPNCPAQSDRPKRESPPIRWMRLRGAWPPTRPPRQR